jgi:uncharacterized phage-associated protein
MLSEGDIKSSGTVRLDCGEQESIDLVLDSYGGFTAHQLSSMTHSEGPWVEARRRADAGPLDRSDEELSDDEIFTFFDALTSADSAGSADADEQEG